MSKYALFVFLILELLILFGTLEEIPNQLFPVISFLSRFTSTGPKSPRAGGGGHSPIKVMRVLIIPFMGLNLWIGTF